MSQHDVLERTHGKMRPELIDFIASNGCTLPMFELWTDEIEKASTFSMRPDDVIVNAYPKSGTNWTQEIVWLICNGADTDAAKAKRLQLRCGYLDTSDSSEYGNGIQTLKKWPEEKTRQAIGKMVSVIRNPKDVCVSYYHFHRMNNMMPEPGTWDEFVETFSSGKCLYGSWFEHVHSHWQASQEHKGNIYLVRYESMKKNLRKEVRNLAKFLEKDLAEDNVDDIVEHCTFSNMQKNESANYSHANNLGYFNFKVSQFLRKGEVGDWKNYFKPDQNAAFDNMYEELTKDWTLKIDFE